MNAPEKTGWNVDDVLELGRSYQPAAVLLAAAELDIFSALAPAPLTAPETAAALKCDARALAILLDALCALGLLQKQKEHYTLTKGVAEALTSGSPDTVLAMARHQANCLRKWAQLAMVVKTGRPAECLPSVGGRQGDHEAFIGAMDNVSRRVADPVIECLTAGGFSHLLDIGGASGTWTMAFLRACPAARATLLDLPPVIPMAQRRLEADGFAQRVTLVPGNYNTGPLPAGADLVWISAIIHQNSRAQNRDLFQRAFTSMAPGGRVAIRDIVMEPDRVHPPAGALFAINMLAATPAGGTFTFEETRSDLEAAGFRNVQLLRPDPGMNAIITAEKPV